MFKEIIISIIIVISIFILDIITQNYTEETVEQTVEMLHDTKEKIKNKEEALAEIEAIFNKWEERRKRLAYFIEHDELEKVETNLTNIKSYIKEQQIEMAISSIDEAEFILAHIEDKNALNLENIF